ncbi:MAG TPA: TolC family outer membrane protein [Steroidobacteraceae bacterium]|nr:TolC family outer membrane protein [Steroidobacteraceae bacterium]
MTVTSRLAAAVLLGLGSSATYAVDLLDVYQRALQSDPVIREAEALRLATLERKPQALAELLPQLNAAGSINRRESEGSTTFLQALDPGPPPTTVIVNTDQETDSDFWQYQVELRQTVFRWDQWVTLQRADAEVAQAQIEYQAAEQDLIVRVAQRYFDVLAASDTLDAAVATAEAVERQLEQAEKRFEVGLIAITDVQEARAANDEAAAAVIAAKRVLSTREELLRELTGELFRELQSPGEDMPLKTPVPLDESEWVEVALEQNLALQSSRLAADIAKENVRLARAGHYPSLDLVLTHTGFDQNADQTNNGLTGPADADQTQDTISLQLNFPIYSGGAVSSSVREQVYRHRAARERLERVARETERATRDAYLGVLSEISRVKALRQAVESGRTALQATEAGFEVGTRTTVDVLNARRQLFQAVTNYARSRYDYVINLIQLQQAAGMLNRSDLDEINSWLE